MKSHNVTPRQAFVKKQRAALDVFVTTVQDRLTQAIVKVVLFGSFARGDSNEESDIDVLVVCSGDRSRISRELAHITLDLMLETGILISALAVTTEELSQMQERKTPFYRNLKQEGDTIG